LLVHIEDNKEFLWDGILTLLKPRKITYSIIQLSQMVYALRFIHKDFVEEQQHKTKMKQWENGKLKDLTKEEKDKIKKDKKEEQRKRRNKHEWRIKISLKI
jgi:hypothetical protein